MQQIQLRAGHRCIRLIAWRCSCSSRLALPPLPVCDITFHAPKFRQLSATSFIFHSRRNRVNSGGSRQSSLIPAKNVTAERGRSLRWRENRKKSDGIELARSAQGSERHFLRAQNYGIDNCRIKVWYIAIYCEIDGSWKIRSCRELSIFSAFLMFAKSGSTLLYLALSCSVVLYIAIFLILITLNTASSASSINSALPILTQL